MAVDSFPNNAHNDRAISLPENEQLWAGTPSGMIGYTGQTPVYADGTGRQVKVRAGVAGRVRGTRFNNTTETIVALTTNGSGNPRVDLVVARLRRGDSSPGAGDAYTVTYAAIAGVASATPVAPQPVRNDTVDGSGVWDIPLAEVRVGPSYTTVTGSGVTNRASWISPSGYHGLDAAKPPAEPGVLFLAHDTGTTYIATAAGAWVRIRFNTGWVGFSPPDGYSSGSTLHVARTGDQVTANVRAVRTGGAVNANVGQRMTTLTALFRPGMTVWAASHCTNPERSGYAYAENDGGLTFAGGSTGIAQGASLITNMTWIADN